VHAQVPLPGGPGNTMALSPDETWLAVSDASNGLVNIFSVDPSTGAVGGSVAVTDVSLGVSAVANGIAFDQGGRLVIISLSSDEVGVYGFTPRSGQIAQDASRLIATPSNPSRITDVDLNEDGIVSRISSCHGTWTAYEFQMASVLHAVHVTLE
jgi:sugar lactone lactonase YvrE